MQQMFITHIQVYTHSSKVLFFPLSIMVMPFWIWRYGFWAISFFIVAELIEPFKWAWSSYRKKKILRICVWWKGWLLYLFALLFLCPTVLFHSEFENKSNSYLCVWLAIVASCFCMHGFNRDFGVQTYDPQLHSSLHLCSFLWSLGSWHMEGVPSALPTHSKCICKASASLPSPSSPWNAPLRAGKRKIREVFLQAFDWKTCWNCNSFKTSYFNFVKYYISDSYLEVLRWLAEEKGSNSLKLWRRVTPAKHPELWLLTTSGNQVQYILLLLLPHEVFHSLTSEMPHWLLLDMKHTNPEKHPTATEHEKTSRDGAIHGLFDRAPVQFMA